MNVLFMNNSKGAACYGIERWMLNTALQLQARGHGVFLAARPESGLYREAAQRGLRGLPSRPRAGLAWLEALRLRAFLARARMDGLCVKNYKHLRLAALARIGLPVMVLCRRGNSGDIRDTWRHRWTVTRCADAILVPSEALRREFCRCAWLDPRRVVVLHHEIDAAAAAAARPAAGLPPCACRVVFAGRLGFTKGTDVLLKAWRTVQAAAPGARLLLVGGNEDRDYRRLAGELGVGGTVDFAGYQPDAKPWIAASDLLVLPSRREGAGFVLLEAMALARPCIGARVGGIPEYIEEGTTGLLVPPGEVGPLANALLELIRDPARRRALGEAGRRRAETVFPPGRALDTLIALLGRGRAGPHPAA